jgi:hypothetical protein
MVNDETLCSIRCLADSVIDNKIEDLFDEALKIRKWLDIDSVAFGTCPRCKKESMEISGEGITSDGKHYPMEECLYCDRKDPELQDSKDVVVKGKGFHFEADIDDSKAIIAIRLTEFGKYSDEIEMLEAYDFVLNDG